MFVPRAFQKHWLLILKESVNFRGSTNDTKGDRALSEIYADEHLNCTMQSKRKGTSYTRKLSKIKINEKER